MLTRTRYILPLGLNLNRPSTSLDEPGVWAVGVCGVGGFWGWGLGWGGVGLGWVKVGAGVGWNESGKGK